MRVIRTLFWIVLTAVLVAFIAMNWQKAPVNIWPVEGGYLHLEWPVGLIALAFYLLGFVPLWLWSRGSRWRLNRRIGALEASIRNAAPSPPLATTSQIAAEEQMIKDPSGT